jgi:alpha-1,3-rhamnosyl/mannosyltransferase
VASRASSLPEVLGDAALLVPPEDTDALADALERVLTDAALAADLRRRGPVHAATFTWERTARATLAVYTEAARR